MEMPKSHREKSPKRIPCGCASLSCQKLAVWRQQSAGSAWPIRATALWNITCYNRAMRLKERLYRFRSFWIFPLLAVLLLYATFRSETQARLLNLVWLLPLGLLIWSLLEYGLHRFVFHIRFKVQNPRLRDVLNASHLSHHAAP